MHLLRSIILDGKGPAALLLALLLMMLPGSRGQDTASLHAQPDLIAAVACLENCTADAETGNCGASGLPLDENDFPEFAHFTPPVSPPTQSVLSPTGPVGSPERPDGGILLPPENHA
jgi:hypothetical protein